MQNNSFAPDQSRGERVSLWIHRIVILLVFLMVFFPPFNPGRISTQISGNLTLLTSATSFSTIIANIYSAFNTNSGMALERTGKDRECC